MAISHREYLKSRGNTPTKPVKGGKAKEESVDDFCRLCGVNFKVKFGNFQKSTRYLSTENLFKPSGRAKRDGKTLAEICSEIGLNIVESSLASSRVCQSCGRKIFNAAELFHFIRSGLEKNVEVPLISTPHKSDSQARIKRLLPSSVSSPDRSPQPKKGINRGSSPSKKSLNFSGSTPLSTSNTENMPLDVSQEIITPRDRHFSSQMNIENLCGKQTTQIKVLIVNPNGRIDSHCSFDDETKSIILNACRKNWSTVANMIMKHSHVRQELEEPLRKAVAGEFKEYCQDTTDSMLKKSSPEDLSAFSNRFLAHEVGTWCPLWMACLKGACNVKDFAEEDGKVINSVALSSAVAAKCRNPKMSAAAYRISTILFHSGVKHEDLRLLNNLGVCMSPDSIVELQKKMGENCESKLLHWKNEIEKVKGARLLLNEVKEKQVGIHDDEEMRIDIDFSEETLKSYKFYGPNISTYCQDLFVFSGKSVRALTDEDVAAASNELANVKLPFYRVVGDNIDLMVHARIQSEHHENRSIHWTQQYAVLNRVQDSSLGLNRPRKPLKEVQFIDLLPNQSVQQQLKERWAVLVARTVCRYLTKFQSQRDVVIWHIPHMYSKEMASKSQTCSLGVEFFNPNIGSEMSQLMISNQKKYVPTLKTDAENIILKSIPFHGDQLFEERARNIQWAYQDGDNAYDRLEGLETEFADWHAKLNLYMVEFDTFMSHSSAAEVGTTRASINRTSKTNAAKGVSNHYNEYKEFHQREVEAHICASFMEMSGMEKIDDEPDYDIPSKDYVSQETRRKWLHEMCLKHVEKYIMANEVEPLIEQVQELQSALSTDGFHCRVDGCDRSYIHHSARVKHEVSQHGLVKDVYQAGRERDMLGYFHCRASCGLVFSTKAIRNNHEKTIHPNFSLEINEETEEEEKEESVVEDYLFNYHRSKLAFGLILLEMDDAIKEGDGRRLHDLYKFALLIYKAYGKTKYAYAVLLYLVKIEAILSEEEAHSLLWNRTFNKYGVPGRNIPLDLRMEQLNKDVKCMWRALQANINEGSAERVANTVEPMEGIRDSIKKDCGLLETPGHRSSGKPESAVLQVTEDLVKIEAFKHETGRQGHPSFPDFPSNLLRKIDYRDLHTWMKGLIKTWEPIYEFNRVD